MMKPILIAKEHEKRVDTYTENTYYDFQTKYVKIYCLNNYFIDSSRKSFPTIKDKPSIYASFIVPAYNEENRIRIMLDEAIDYCINRNKRDKHI